MPLLMVRVVIIESQENASRPMCVTLLGMAMPVSRVSLRKAFFGMSVMFWLKVAFLSRPQLRNSSSLRLVT